MSLSILIAVASVIALIAGIVPYIFDVLAKRARPNIVSFGGWTLLTVIGSAAQIAKGADLSVVVPIISSIGTGIVFLLAIRYGYTKFNLVDKISIPLALLAMALWLITNEPLTALILSVIADGIVAIPTLVKTYRDPTSETPFPWFMFAIGSALGIAALSNFDLHNILFPIYLICINAVIGILALRGKFIKDKTILPG